MPKPLSNDLRKRVVDAKLRGDTENKIAPTRKSAKVQLPNYGLFIEKPKAIFLAPIPME
jgi:hypothetical protein